jgi:hypothetical protein
VEQAVAGDNGTNWSVPYFNQWLFNPWLFYGNQTNIYGTNAGGFPLLTNNWGATTNFPITGLFMGSTNTQTLTNSDTLPVFASAQKTNTTMTLDALYQYLTNRNALPPYTVARIQFSGYPLTLTLSNNANTSQNLVNVTTNGTFVTNQIYAFSLITNGQSAPVWANWANNQLYYGVPTPTNAMWWKVFTNYANALAGTPAIPITAAGSGTAAKFLYLTNYTSFNADVIQTQASGSVQPGVYLVWFRNGPAANALYYINGIVQEFDVNQAPGLLSLFFGYPPNTNNFEIMTSYGVGSTLIIANFPLVHVQVSPQ